MSEPSVKGTLVQGAAEELWDLIVKQTVERERVERELEPEELGWVEQGVVITRWYPIAGYARLLETIAGALGRCDDAYFIESGHGSAQRLVQLGIYRQLDAPRIETWEDRVGRLLITLAPGLYDFGHWKWRVLGDDTGFEVAFCEAGAMPHCCALRAQGFIEHLARRAAGRPVVVGLERSPDGATLLFHSRGE